jgi:hypothetical protein
LLEGSVVGILVSDEAFGQVEGPAEVGGILVEVVQEKAAEAAASHADKGRDCDSFSQR